MSAGQRGGGAVAGSYLVLRMCYSILTTLVDTLPITAPLPPRPAVSLLGSSLTDGDQRPGHFAGAL